VLPLGGIAQGELALEFLYWPNASIEREENLKTRPCILLRLHSPTRSSQYSVVFAWVDKETGALMRIEGHDWEGRLVRRFEVISGQKIDRGWLLKQMRIQAIDPTTQKTTRRVYLEILDKAE
jgi:negative regulator of sigma E activity